MKQVDKCFISLSWPLQIETNDILFISSILKTFYLLVANMYLVSLCAQVSFAKHLSFIVCLSVQVSIHICSHNYIKFSRTIGPISTKLGTEHLWVKGFLFCSNEGSCPFSTRRYSNKLKKYWQLLKIVYTRTTDSISTQLDREPLRVKRINFRSNDGLCLFSYGR